MAILAVMAFHFGVPGLTGGFLGVDVFFVLSGFLITSVLLAEWERGGQIDLRRFWDRRARRLLPGLGLVLVAISVWAAIARLPNATSARDDAVATVSYLANWRFVLAHRGYFDQFGAPSPFAHTWSLAIEEQFYIVWPLLTIPVLVHWGARGLRNVAVGGAAISAGLCAVLFASGANTSRLYYGTDTRAQAILVGAALASALALRPQQRWATWHGTLASLVGAGMLLVGAHALTGTSRLLYGGGFTIVALATAALIVGVIATPAGPISRALSWWPLRATGLISYELYLWHWPVLVALTSARSGLNGFGLLTTRVLVTGALATASWALVGGPILRGQVRLPKPGAIRFCAFSAAAIVVVVAIAAVGSGQTSPQMTAVRLADTSTPIIRPPVHAVLLGDSVALTLGDGLLDRERSFGVDLIDGGLIGCGVLGSGQVRVAGVAVQVAAGCRNWEIGWRSLLAQQHPDVVAILVGRWEVVDRDVDGRWTQIGDPAFDAFIAAQLDRAVDAAASTGARVMVMTSPHFAGVERPDGGRWPEDDPSRVDRFNRLVRAAVARHPSGATLFDLATLSEPTGRYTSTLKGIATRRPDGVHFTESGADLLAPAVLTEIDRMDAASIPVDRSRS